jgi:hypothetical protein
LESAQAKRGGHTYHLTLAGGPVSAHRNGDLSSSLARSSAEPSDWDRNYLRVAVEPSPARIVTTADEARKRLERDLHDGAQQRFVLASG